MITQKELKEILEYDPATGLFMWKESRGRIKAGDAAGSKHGTYGYIYIRINKKSYRAHRLAYLYMVGEFPEDQIDHRNMVRDDNSWLNLRDSTNIENQKNKTNSNPTGVTGLTIREKGNGIYWEASIKIESKSKYLGSSHDKFEAICLRKSAEIKAWGRSPIQLVNNNSGIMINSNTGNPVHNSM